MFDSGIQDWVTLSNTTTRISFHFLKSAPAFSFFMLFLLPNSTWLITLNASFTISRINYFGEKQNVQANKLRIPLSKSFLFFLLLKIHFFIQYTLIVVSLPLTPFRSTPPCILPKSTLFIPSIMPTLPLSY